MADLVQALGIASARIYAAFGSKQDLFREAVQRYEAGDGGFADRAMAQEPRVRDALARVLRDAVTTYTDDAHPLGCMVVTAATNCAEENEEVAAWLAGHRRLRTQSLIDRLQRALDEGELRAGTDVQALGISMPRNCTASPCRPVTACRASGCWLRCRPPCCCWTRRWRPQARRTEQAAPPRHARTRQTRRFQAPCFCSSARNWITLGVTMGMKADSRQRRAKPPSASRL